MVEEGLWVLDPETETPVFLPYSEMEGEAKRVLLRPLGGFIYRANEFVQLELPPVPYYIKDWLPKQGSCVLYAPPKAGKSFLAAQIARCIASGEPFLGFPTTQGTVLMIQSELGAEILQGRLRMTGRDYSNVSVGTTFSLRLDTDSGFAQLWRAMEAIKPDVLILDPLYKMIAGDENESKDMKGITDNLDKIKEAYKCSIWIVHHAGKDITKGGRGSSVLEDWVDSYLEARRISKPGEPLKVRITPKLLRHAELTPEPLIAEMRNFEFQLVDGTPTVKGEVKQFIKSRFELTGEPINRGDILKCGIGSNASVQDALNGLLEEGVIVRVARGEYIWNQEG